MERYINKIKHHRPQYSTVELNNATPTPNRPIFPLISPKSLLDLFSSKKLKSTENLAYFERFWSSQQSNAIVSSLFVLVIELHAKVTQRYNEERFKPR